MELDHSVRNNLLCTMEKEHGKVWETHCTNPATLAVPSTPACPCIRYTFLCICYSRLYIWYSVCPSTFLYIWYSRLSLNPVLLSVHLVIPSVPAPGTFRYIWYSHMSLQPVRRLDRSTARYIYSAKKH
jgi:hypothetical protein